MKFDAVQSYMREQRIDAWLLWDFRGSNSIFAQVLPGKRWTTRRALLLIPAHGDASLLTHGIDHHQFNGVEVPKELYLSWRDLHAWLGKKLGGLTRVAMEYAPGGGLPVVSIVDGGTIELIRSLGHEVVSSANLIQVCVARWPEEAVAAHKSASSDVDKIKNEAFQFIREQIAAHRTVHEHEVQQFIMKRFEQSNLVASEAPIVAVNAHSGDPHYEPSEKNPTPICRGDWVLIDLWARRPKDPAVFSDITWVGFVGKDVPAKHREVFNVVKNARDRVVERAVAAWKNKETIQGWQLDEVARATIIDAGYSKFIRHRTGHSLSPGPMVHGVGFNLDNLETHDTREMLPGLGFTIEPGIYLPEFGVREEINVYVDPVSGPTVTSGIQTEPILIA